MKQTILPERLLSCRNNLGLTQSEAAELIGITQPAYQRYEAGVRTPSIQVAKEIAKAFNVSTAYLYGDSDQSLPDYFVIDKKDNQILFSIILIFMGKKLLDESDLPAKIEPALNSFPPVAVVVAITAFGLLVAFISYLCSVRIMMKKEF